MTTQLNELAFQQRRSELICRAEEARLLSEARAASTSQSLRRGFGQRLQARLRAARLAAAAPADPQPPHGCLECDA